MMSECIQRFSSKAIGQIQRSCSIDCSDCHCDALLSPCKIWPSYPGERSAFREDIRANESIWEFIGTDDNPSRTPLQQSAEREEIGGAKVGLLSKIFKMFVPPKKPVTIIESNEHIQNINDRLDHMIATLNGDDKWFECKAIEDKKGE